MKLKYTYTGEKHFLSYPDEAVTVGKIYKTFKNFEIPNTDFFIGDDKKIYKVIITKFEKIK